MDPIMLVRITETLDTKRRRIEVILRDEHEDTPFRTEMEQAHSEIVRLLDMLLDDEQDASALMAALTAFQERLDAALVVLKAS